MAITQKEFHQRRMELMNHMESNSIAILAAANPILRNGDSEYRYRQNSDMYYLTGFGEANSVLVLIPGRDKGQCLLFCQEKDPVKELWTGKLLGPEAAITQLGMDDAFPISDIDDILPGLIYNIFYRPVAICSDKNNFGLAVMLTNLHSRFQTVPARHSDIQKNDCIRMACGN